MNEILKASLDNLKTHPAGYTVIMLVLALTIAVVPQLSEEDRLIAFIVATILVTIGVLYLHSSEVKNSGNSNENDLVMQFPSPPDGKYNTPFYDYFINKIENSKQDIYITGDGFECANEEGTKLAKRFYNAFNIALSKGISVVRVETKSQGSLKWTNMLAELVDKFGDSFHLYIIKDRKSAQMASVCVIDAETSESTVEIMLSTQRLFGVKAADLAGTAVFVNKQQYLAQDLRRRILNLKNPELSFNPRTRKDVIEILAKKEHYFAFGSNMDEIQMTERCPSAQKIGIGVLPNHGVVFNRKGTYRPGGVASVEYTKGIKIYGIIWEISSIDFENLDKIENPNAYKRTEENIYMLDGKSYSCHVYKAIPEGKFEPDTEYLEIMIHAANTQNLPEEYIEYLSTFKHEGKDIS